MNILLSIKPKWADLIYKGEKQIEWRKNFPKFFNPFIDIIFLYETKPVCYVTGWIKLNGFTTIYHSELYTRTKFIRVFEEIGKIKIDDLKKYSKGQNLYCWLIRDYYKMPYGNIKYFSPTEKPPQSWSYTNAYLCNGTLNYDHKIKYDD